MNRQAAWLLDWMRRAEQQRRALTVAPAPTPTHPAPKARAGQSTESAAD